MLDREHLGVMDMRAERNAFGRQIRSFEADLEIAGVDGPPVRAVFIRAPWVAEHGDGRRGARRGRRPSGRRPRRATAGGRLPPRARAARRACTSCSSPAHVLQILRSRRSPSDAAGERPAAAHTLDFRGRVARGGARRPRSRSPPTVVCALGHGVEQRRSRRATQPARGPRAWRRRRPTSGWRRCRPVAVSAPVLLERVAVRAQVGLEGARILRR